MPIKNLTPDGLDRLLSNRTKKSLLSKKNKHLQHLAKMPKIDRMTHCLDMNVFFCCSGTELKAIAYI